MKRSSIGLATAIALATAGLGAGTAVAQQASSTLEGWGSTAAPGTAKLKPATSLPAITASVTFQNAQIRSGGVGLRNRGGGTFSISGVTPPVKAAYLYWGIINYGAAKTSKVRLTRLSAAGVGSPMTVTANLTGTQVGTGGTPCWGGDTIAIYRATVPTKLAVGNGEYQVSILKGTAGNTSGASPWDSSAYALPLWEGASMLVVGTGTATVGIYDKGLAGAMFYANPGLTYSLTLPVAAPGYNTIFETINADGQRGTELLATAWGTNETTTINNVLVAGPGSIANDGDWNGNAALPLPQLWDDNGRDITTAVPSGTTALNIAVANSTSSTSDCLVPVANAVALK